MKTVKIFLLTLPVHLIVLSVSAQTTERSVIASTGRTASAGNIRVDYTLGEAVVTTLKAPTHQLTQGFHQPADVSVGIASQPDVMLRLEAYPNPTEHMLTLSVITSTPHLFTATVYDVAGRKAGLALRAEVNEKYSAIIDVSQLSAGTYFIHVTDDKGRAAGTLRFQKL